MNTISDEAVKAAIRSWFHCHEEHDHSDYEDQMRQAIAAADAVRSKEQAELPGPPSFPITDETAIRWLRKLLGRAEYFGLFNAGLEIITPKALVEHLVDRLGPVEQPIAAPPPGTHAAQASGGAVKIIKLLENYQSHFGPCCPDDKDDAAEWKRIDTAIAALRQQPVTTMPGMAIGYIDEGEEGGAFVEIYPDRDFRIGDKVYLAQSLASKAGLPDATDDELAVEVESRRVVRAYRSRLPTAAPSPQEQKE